MGLAAGLSEKHRAGIERAIKSCPAYGTLLHSSSVDLAIESPAGAPAAQARSA